ncbi:MAG: hypothetical protein ACREP6_05115 [Candidatus Binataceae bacterium]
MGIADADPTLPSNRMVFEVRRDPKLLGRFHDDLESLMTEYRLSDEEKRAFREVDIRKLAELGLHPYFLPQVSRLFQGAAYNHNRSAAAQLFAAKMLGERDKAR